MPNVVDRPTSVYRLYDASGALLYIGMTNDPATRWSYHALTKSWWPNVARKTVEWHPDRSAAERAEAAAIREENPLHNWIHSQVGPDDMPLRDARAKLSDMVDQVRILEEPRWITRHGRRAAVLVSPDFFERALAALGRKPADADEYTA